MKNSLHKLFLYSQGRALTCTMFLHSQHIEQTINFYFKYKYYRYKFALSNISLAMSNRGRVASRLVYVPA